MLFGYNDNDGNKDKYNYKNIVNNIGLHIPNNLDQQQNQHQAPLYPQKYVNLSNTHSNIDNSDDGGSSNKIVSIQQKDIVSYNSNFIKGLGLASMIFGHTTGRYSFYFLL